MSTEKTQVQQAKTLRWLHRCQRSLPLQCRSAIPGTQKGTHEGTAVENWYSSIFCFRYHHHPLPRTPLPTYSLVRAAGSNLSRPAGADLSPVLQQRWNVKFPDTTKVWSSPTGRVSTSSMRNSPPREGRRSKMLRSIHEGCWLLLRRWRHLSRWCSTATP